MISGKYTSRDIDVFLRRIELYEMAFDAFPEPIAIFDDSSGSFVFRNQAHIYSHRLSCAQQEQITSLTPTYSLIRSTFAFIESFKLAFDCLPHIIWSTDMYGACDYVNKAWCDYTGLTLQESLGYTARNVVHKDDWQTTADMWQKVLANPELEFNMEYRIRSKDGEYRWFIGRALPFIASDGTIVKWFGTSTDITQLKNVEENFLQIQKELNMKQQLFETCLNNLPVPVVIYQAPAGELVYSNDAASNMWSNKRPEFQGAACNDPRIKEWFEMRDIDDNVVDVGRWPLYRTLLHGECVRNERLHCIIKGVGKMTLKFSSNPVYDETGNMVYCVLMSEDVTEQLKMEDLRVQLLGREQAALETSKLKSEFIANTSHEIRTPLNAILGMAEILLENNGAPLDNEQKESIKIIRDSGNLLLVIINDILDFAKSESGKLQLANQRFSIRETVRQIDNFMRSSAEAKNLRFTCSCSPDFDDCMIGDQPRLMQILLNLVNNAVKFCNHGQVSLEVTGNFVAEKGEFLVCFIVRDTGIGMDAATLGRLYEPFMQADSSSVRQFGGTGLGLSIVKRLIELMKGEIYVESEINRGTCFKVIIPFHACCESMETSTDSESHSSPFISKANTSILKRLTVLVAEDNFVNQKLVVRLLKRLGVNHVDVVGNGLEAFECYRKYHEMYDIILMDCQMPVLDGYQGTRRIREFETRMDLCSIPIVAFTASALQNDQEACLSAGMNDHIPKPCKPEHLLEILLKWST